MNRPLVALFSVLEALLVVGIGVGVTLVPLSVLWAFEYGLQVDWIVFWRVAANAWLLGHGVDVLITLDPLLAVATGIDGAAEPFELGIAALGFALITVLLAARAGRRITETDHRSTGVVVAVLSVAFLSMGITLAASSEAARPSLAQGILFPTLTFAFGLAWGAVVTRRRLRARREPQPAGRIQELTARIPEHARVLAAHALRGGGAAVAMVLVVSAVLGAGLMAVNYANLIALYEGIHAGVLGGVAVTVAQLAILPNLVIWGAAWLVGPGFAIGTGSWVGPLGTHLGPTPAVPVFGALPPAELPFGFVGIAVPVVAGFIAGLVIRSQLVRRLGDDVAVGTRAATGALIGIAGGLILGLLAVASAGAAGPGRLADVGPDALLVALWSTVEFGVPAVLALVVGGSRVDAAQTDESVVFAR